LGYRTNPQWFAIAITVGISVSLSYYIDINLRTTVSESEVLLNMLIEFLHSRLLSLEIAITHH